MKSRWVACSLAVALFGCRGATDDRPLRLESADPSGLERVTVWIDGARCLF
jgi:hypothetical protein